jgi:hypothetical protein
MQNGTLPDARGKRSPKARADSGGRIGIDPDAASGRAQARCWRQRIVSCVLGGDPLALGGCGTETTAHLAAFLA